MAKKKSKKNTKKTKKKNSEQIKAPVREINLSGLTLIDLISLQNALPGIIEQAKLNEKQLLKEKMIALAAESGFELSEILEEPSENVDTKKKRKQIGFVKARYSNPNNQEQTWSGRGRKPKWAADYLADGGKLQELLINSESK